MPVGASSGIGWRSGAVNRVGGDCLFGFINRVPKEPKAPAFLPETATAIVSQMIYSVATETLVLISFVLIVNLNTLQWSNPRAGTLNNL